MAKRKVSKKAVAIDNSLKKGSMKKVANKKTKAYAKAVAKNGFSNTKNTKATPKGMGTLNTKSDHAKFTTPKNKGALKNKSDYAKFTTPKGKNTLKGKNATTRLDNSQTKLNGRKTVPTKDKSLLKKFADAPKASEMSKGANKMASIAGKTAKPSKSNMAAMEKALLPKSKGEKKGNILDGMKMKPINRPNNIRLNDPIAPKNNKPTTLPKAPVKPATPAAPPAAKAPVPTGANRAATTKPSTSTTTAPQLAAAVAAAPKTGTPYTKAPATPAAPPAAKAPATPAAPKPTNDLQRPADKKYSYADVGMGNMTEDKVKAKYDQYYNDAAKDWTAAADKQKTAANAEANKVQNANYVNYMMAQKAMPDQLARLGVSGGASESSLIRANTNYSAMRGRAESDRAKAIGEINSKLTDNLSSYRRELAQKRNEENANNASEFYNRVEADKKNREEKFRWDTEQKRAKEQADREAAWKEREFKNQENEAKWQKENADREYGLKVREMDTNDKNTQWQREFDTNKFNYEKVQGDREYGLKKDEAAENKKNTAWEQKQKEKEFKHDVAQDKRETKFKQKEANRSWNQTKWERKWEKSKQNLQNKQWKKQFNQTNKDNEYKKVSDWASKFDDKKSIDKEIKKYTKKADKSNSKKVRAAARTRVALLKAQKSAVTGKIQEGKRQVNNSVRLWEKTTGKGSNTSTPKGKDKPKAKAKAKPKAKGKDKKSKGKKKK